MLSEVVNEKDEEERQTRALFGLGRVIEGLEVGVSTLTKSRLRANAAVSSLHR